jgi:hypothetical protein
MFPDEQDNDLRKKLDKTKSKHVAYSLLVGLGGLVLFGLAERFPNVEWTSVGMFWFFIVMALGYILR